MLLCMPLLLLLLSLLSLKYGKKLSGIFRLHKATGRQKFACFCRLMYNVQAYLFFLEPLPVEAPAPLPCVEAHPKQYRYDAPAHIQVASFFFFFFAPHSMVYNWSYPF